MGRKKKGIFVQPESLDRLELSLWKKEGDYIVFHAQEVGARDDLIDWLNRARMGGVTDREGAERIGLLIDGMNQAAFQFYGDLKQMMKRGSSPSPPESSRSSIRTHGNRQANAGLQERWKEYKSETCDVMRPTISQSYLLQHATLRAVSPDYQPEFDLLPSRSSNKWKLLLHCDTPSGDGTEFQARWHGESDVNPESLAVRAVVFIALDGQLGTISRCEVASCRKWFLSKDD